MHPIGSTLCRLIPLFSIFAFSITILSGCVTPSRDAWKPFPALAAAEKRPIDNVRGHLFPNLKFRDPDGTWRTLKDYRGRVVFLNFWASWCGPCQLEMPGLQKLYDALKDDPDFAFLIINIKEDYEVGRRWAERKGYKFPLSNSEKVSRSELQLSDGKTYFVRDIPDTFILDRNGVVVAVFGGDHLDFDLYVDHMLELAGKPRRGAPAKSGV